LTSKKQLKNTKNKKLRSHHPPIHKEPKDCKTVWPICLEVIEKNDKTRAKSLFAYRVNHITDHIIANYFNNEKESPYRNNKPITRYNTTSNLLQKSEKISIPISSDSFNLQDNVVVGRHTHICKEGHKEKEVNASKISQKNYAEDSLFKTIEDASPLLYRGRTQTKKIEEIPARERGKTDYTKLSVPDLKTVNSEKRGLNLAGSFQNVLKQSGGNLKSSSGITESTGMSSSGKLTAVQIGLMTSQKISMGKAQSNMINEQQLSMISINTEDSPSKMETSSLSKGGNSSLTGSDKSGEVDNESEGSKIVEDDDSFTDEDYESNRGEYAKSVFDILEEVKENKNKLVDKFMDFNRSFIFMKGPSQ